MVDRHARTLRRVAVAILVIGTAASVSIWLSANQATDPVELGSGSMAEQRELQQLERLGGKFSLMTLRFQRWFESLWHGERLAASIAVLSVLAAWLCLHLATLADEDLDQ